MQVQSRTFEFFYDFPKDGWKGRRPSRKMCRNLREDTSSLRQAFRRLSRTGNVLELARCNTRRAQNLASPPNSLWHSLCLLNISFL
jgi:hypothetical protein